MSQNDIEMIELSIEEARKMVMRGEAARRLADNPDFKKIVLDGYFVEEAARLVLLSTDPALDDKIRHHVQVDMAGPGAFKRYLSTAVQLGLRAEREIAEAMEALDEIRQMELDGDAEE